MPDRAGNTLQSDFTFDFFLLGGDANHDRTVNDIDLGIFSTHWNTSGQNYSQGDFNYDGFVDVADFKVITDHWQTTLAAPPPSAAPVSDSTAPRSKKTRTIATIVD
jgi:hypothetical protein